MLKARTFQRIILAGFVFCGTAVAKDIPPLTGPVIDETGTLSIEQRQQLSSELMAMKEDVQMQIWMVRNLEDETLETLAIKAFDVWKLGDAKKDNGALVLVAMDERRSRIEVGRGLEGSVPDVVAAKVIDSVLTPHFRAGDFYGGLSKSTRFIYELSTGRASPQQLPREQRRRQGQGIPIWLVIAVFILVSIMGGRGGGRRRRGSGLGYLGAGWALGRMGRGGWSGGGGGWGGGGGGSWGGGGGSSAGGGASGGW